MMRKVNYLPEVSLMSVDVEQLALSWWSNEMYKQIHQHGTMVLYSYKVESASLTISVDQMFKKNIR